MATRQTTTRKQTGKGGAKTGKVITDGQIETARERGNFIKAVGTGTLKLSGAERNMWPTNPDVVYNLTYRVVGTPQEVRDLLARSGLKKEDIDAALENETITFQNYQGDMADAYDEEIERAGAARAEQRERAAEEPQFTLNDLDKVVTQLGMKPGAIGATKGTGARATGAKATGTASPRARGPRSPLLERVNALGEGEVLDVSAITAEGTGAKKMKAPAGKSRKVGVTGLPIISNNYQAYQRAIALLGPDYTKYAEQYGQLYGTGPEAIVPATATISPKARGTTTAKATGARTTGGAKTTTTGRTAAPIRRATTTATPTTAQQTPATTGTTAQQTGTATTVRRVARPLGGTTRVTGQVNPTATPTTAQQTGTTAQPTTTQQTGTTRRVLPARGGVNPTATGARGGKLAALLQKATSPRGTQP